MGEHENKASSSVAVIVVKIIIIIHVQVFLDKTILPVHKLQFHNVNIMQVITAA